MTAGTDGRGNPSANPADNLLGRRPRAMLSGLLTARAYGQASSPDLAIDSDARGDRAAFPGHGQGSALTGSNSFFGLRLPHAQRPGAWYSPGGPGGAYGGGWADGDLTVRDRHILSRTGTVRHSRAQANGVSPVNPEADGPPRPEYQMVNTTESWQLGTDNTANQDNSEPKSQVPVIHQAGSIHALYGFEPTGRRAYPLGTQDGSLTIVMGPPLDSWREYGSRGPRGMHGPQPDLIDPNVRGSATVVMVPGAPGMQATDRRQVWGGPPHGLHSPTVNSTRFTGARYASTIQMAPPRVDRPNNSKIAGQSYSQTIVPEAGSGFNQSNATPRMPNPGRTPGIRDRFVPR